MQLINIMDNVILETKKYFIVLIIVVYLFISQYFLETNKQL